MEIIKINNVSKNYKNTKALNNINLSINEGKIYCLLGVNGAGKTTLLKILSGLTNQTSGDFIVNCMSSDITILTYDFLSN